MYMTMITDKTIDTSTAKYWCLFSDQELQKSLSKLGRDKDQQKKLKKKASSKGEVNENIVLNILGYAGYLFTAMSLANLVTPYLKNAWRKMSKDGSLKIAEVQFEADGSDYSAWFDMDDFKWQLHSEASVTPQETMQFFETQFFQKFNQQCAQYIVPILNSKDSIMENISEIEPAKMREIVKKLLDNSNRIVQNMFEAKYLT